MIFVTVGTQIQPFNRVIKEIDILKQEGVIAEEVFIQLGHSTYIPENCNYSKLISFEKMQENFKNADIVITHGTPASVINALRNGTIPIVIPRQKKYGEDINDRQVDFTKEVERKKIIIPIYNIKELKLKLINYRSTSFYLKNNVPNYTKPVRYLVKLEKIVKDI